MPHVWSPRTPGVARAYVTGAVEAGAYVSVPDGRCGLAWVHDRLWWLGPATRPRRATRSAACVVGVRLHHVVARAFSGTSLVAWRDREVELRHLLDDTGGLERDLRRATSHPQRAQAMAAYVAARTDPRSPDGVAERVLHAAEAGDTVADLAMALGLSTRQLHRRCLDVFGMPPTTLRRIVRLHAAATERTARPDSSFADVAAAAGFSDQAHFTRDVRDLTLTSPRRALPHPAAAASDWCKTGAQSRS